MENYTKSILKNFYNKEWGKKLFFPILILAILAAVQLIGLNKINHIAYNASIINAFDKNSSQEKNIIELYNIENDISGNSIIDEIFNLKLGNEEKILRIKGSRELIGNDIDKKVSIFLNKNRAISDDSTAFVVCHRTHNRVMCFGLQFQVFQFFSNWSSSSSRSAS